MAAVTAVKKAMRREVAEKLKLISTQDIEKQSLEVFKLLSGHACWRSSMRASVYLNTAGEVITGPIVKALFQSGCQVFVPQCIGQQMRMLKVSDEYDVASLPRTKWNIPQPAIDDIREDAMDSGGLDVVIVPGVAFTKDGHRLGHGAGYYDRFLCQLLDFHMKQEVPIKPITIAIALKEQIYDKVPVTEDDFKVDFVLYPQSSQ